MERLKLEGKNELNLHLLIASAKGIVNTES